MLKSKDFNLTSCSLTVMVVKNENRKNDYLTKLAIKFKNNSTVPVFPTCCLSASSPVLPEQMVLNFTKN